MSIIPSIRRQLLFPCLAVLTAACGSTDPAADCVVSVPAQHVGQFGDSTLQLTADLFATCDEPVTLRVTSGRVVPASIEGVGTHRIRWTFHNSAQTDSLVADDEAVIIVHGPLDP